MKVIDMWKTGRKPTISFELFPAKSEKAVGALNESLAALAALKPDFVSVTFGAGGSTRDGSRQLVARLRTEFGQQVVAYFAGYGLSPADITAVLDSYRSIGVENILIVRGDPPQDKDFQPHSDSFAHATDILGYVRPRYDFCFGVAGYPEAHIHAESKEKDLEFLKLKVDRGAQYIITNYFYDNRFFFDFITRCRKAGITVPILPGIMPIYSVKMMEMLAGLCGATITDALRKEITALPADNKDALNEFGVEFATRQCAELLKAGVPGLHFYTMDRSSSTAGIVNRLRKDGFL